VKGLARRLPFLENFPRENQNGVSATWKAISALCNGDDDRPANEEGPRGRGRTGRRRGGGRRGDGRTGGGENGIADTPFIAIGSERLYSPASAKSSNENTTQARCARARGRSCYRLSAPVFPATIMRATSGAGRRAR